MTDIISSDLDDDMKNSWRTDPRVFNALNREFNFALDAACSDDNFLCPTYMTKEKNALQQDWSSFLDARMRVLNANNIFYKTVWINPPYGRGHIKRFMNKCIEQKAKGVTSVMLVPNSLEAGWLNFDEINEIRVITGGRLSFYNPITNKKINGNTRGSMIVVFRGNDKSPCFVRLIDRDHLLSLGRI